MRNAHLPVETSISEYLVAVAKIRLSTMLFLAAILSFTCPRIILFQSETIPMEIRFTNSRFLGSVVT